MNRIFESTQESVNLVSDIESSTQVSTSSSLWESSSTDLTESDVSVESTMHTGTSPFESDEDVSDDGVSSGGYVLRPRGKRRLSEPTVPLAKRVCDSSSNAAGGHRGNGRGRGRGRGGSRYTIISAQ